MRKFLSLLMMVAFSVAMFANSYWYRGVDNSWGATAMTESTDGLYEYIQSSNNANQFKIATSKNSWDYGWTYVQAGFNSTDVTNIGDYGQDNCYCWQSGDYYILVYKPNTSVNTTANPIICAATTLPEASAGTAETGDAIKLTFCYYNSTSGDGSAKLSTVEAIFDAASQQYVSTVNTGTQVYAGRKYKEGNDSIFSNLKLGSSKAGGELKFTLANPTEVDSIVFRAAMYAAAEGGDGFSVNDTSFALNVGKLVFEDKVWKPTGEVSTIDIVQNKANGGRFFLTSITIYPKAGETPEQPEQPEEVVLPVVKLAGSLSSWSEPVLMVNAEDSLSASLTLNLGIDHYQLKVVSDGNWLSKAGDGDLYTMHRDWNHVDHLDLINTGDNIKLITDVEGAYTFTWTYADSTLVVTFPEAPAKPNYYLIGDSAFVVDAGATADKAWTPDAIPSFQDTTVLNLKAGVNYIMRLSLEGTWENHRDFRHLTDTAAGLIELPDEFGNHSIGFSLAEAGDVTIIYIPAANEQPEVFKLTGNFYVAPAPDPTASVRLEIMEWDETPFELAADKQSASLTINNIHKGNYAFKMFINGEWRSNAGTISRENPTAIVAGNEEGNMTLKADIDGIYTFTWFFANDSLVAIFPEKPVVPMTEIRLVPGVWNVDGAKFAAVTWNEGEVMEDGVVSDWFVGTDTVVGNIPAAADSIGFARFNSAAEVPSMDMSIIWNHTDKMLIDKETMIYTITGWPEEGKDFCPGYWGEYVAPVYDLENGYYLVGNKYNWTPAAERLFTANPETEGEYFLVEVTLEESDSIKVVKVVNDEITDWYPNGDNYVVDAAHVGVKTIYFNPTYQEAWGNNIYIEANAAPFACDWNNIAWLGGSNDQIKVCKESEAVSVVNVQKPGWAAENGIYMTFPSAAWGAISLEEGSYVTEGAGLLVYLSALTQEYNEISIVCQDVEYIITIYNAANAPKPAFYLVGNFNEWTAAEAYKFALNPNNDAEYVLTATLAEYDSLKVIRVMEGEETVWYPAEAENYVVDAAHAGEKDIYFRPDYQGGEDWYAQCIYVAENAPQGCDWDHIDFIGSAVPELADQFKLCKEGQYPSVINIQNSFGTEAGIYVTFPSAAFGEISMTEGTYAIQGAGMLLYCSAFTDVETEVSIVCDGNPIIFTVYNAEGSAPVVDPTVAVMGSMNDWAAEIPFALSDDKTYASLTVENIGADEYEFKFIINGEWRSNGYRYHRDFPGAAGITENNDANMVFVADQDGQYTFTWFFANDSLAITYPEKQEPVYTLTNGYYLVGKFGGVDAWDPVADNLLAQNPDNNAEYQLAINLAVGDEIKVVEVENDAIKTWFPAEGDNYLVDGNHAGATTMYFRPDYQGGEGWFANCIFIVPTGTVDIDAIDANAPAVKVLREGQILIIKGNKIFNAQGQLVK